MRIEHLSVSQIGTFLACPRKYAFRYVDRLPPEHRSSAAALGTAVHSACGWWQEQRMGGAEPSDEEVHRMFDAAWAAELAGGDLDATPEELVEAGVMGRRLVHLYIKTGLPVPDDVEVRFDVPLTDPRTGEELPVPLVGYQDFVVGDVVGEVKTSARKASPSQWALQLAGYSYAHRVVYGVRPTMRVVQLVKTKEPKVVVEDVVVSDAEEDWFLEVAAEAYEAIAAGVRHPIPGWMCGGCEFRRGCRGSEAPGAHAPPSSCPRMQPPIA